MKKNVLNKFILTISQVLKHVEANKVVEKTFKKCKSAGYKKFTIEPMMDMLA